MANKLCGKDAVGVLVWPTGKKVPVCADCKEWSIKVAEALGIPPVFEDVQKDVIPIDRICQQKIDRQAPEAVTEQDSEVYRKQGLSQ